MKSAMVPPQLPSIDVRALLLIGAVVALIGAYCLGSGIVPGVASEQEQYIFVALIVSVIALDQANEQSGESVQD